MTETDDIGQRVNRLFQSYDSPKDLLQLSDYKKCELAKYSVNELYGRDFQRACQILQEIGAPSLPYLFFALGNDRLNHVYNTIMNIATKGKEADEVARHAVGKLHFDGLILTKSMDLIMETGNHSPRYLIHALGNNSIERYAEYMLRKLHADERYTNKVKEELERAQDLKHTYSDSSRERAKVILGTV